MKINCILELQNVLKKKKTSKTIPHKIVDRAVAIYT